MVYGSNVLPSDAAYYQLTKASITNGILNIEAGGSAKCTLSRAQLNALTEYFRINLIPAAYTDSYEPTVYVSIDVETLETWYSYSLFPVQFNNGIFTSEIKFDEADYLQFTFEIVASESTSFALWEMCPESAGNVEVVIDGVKQSLPRLLYDYNTTAIRVEQSEQVVGMISCYLLNTTDLQGHFLMNFNASDRCTVHLRFFDTDISELFGPVVHTVNPGYNTIEVPHAYLQKIVGAHNFYITAQTTNGYLAVPTRGVLYTIDGGYLAERLMNPGMDISDVTIRQLANESSPSEIWGIGVDNNQVIVKKRPYTLNQANALWEAVYTLGEGLYAAIEFDGDWVRRPGSKKHTIHTNALPMMAYVDTHNVLWVYLHGMDSDPIQIASGVTCVSLVRGYKSQLYPEQDQGMVLCWVQGSNVYYKQYAYFNGSYQWHPTEQLTSSGDITFAQVHRLNDFRVGIITQGASENIWYITDRTYVGQSVDTEMVYALADGLCTFITMSADESSNLNFAAVQNTFESAEEPQQDFTVTFVSPRYVTLIYDTIESWKDVVTVKLNGSAVPTDAYDLTISDNVLVFHMNEPVWGNVQISWNKVSFWYHLDNTRKLINTQASYSFSWTIVHRAYFTQRPDTVYTALQGTQSFTVIPVQKIQHTYNDPVIGHIGGTAQFGVLPVAYLHNGSTEQITGALSGVSTFTCELVGMQPI